nr:MAG TPA: hypothetical protein [Caudoviricetes sp.]
MEQDIIEQFTQLSTPVQCTGIVCATIICIAVLVYFYKLFNS